MKKNIKLSAAIATIGIFLAASIYELHSQNSLNNALNVYGFTKPDQKKALNDLFHQAGVILQRRSYSIPSFFEQNQNLLASDILHLVKMTQCTFTIRKGTQERWETRPLEWMLKNKEQILYDLKILGFVRAIKPKIKNPDAVCILGATRKRMATRIGYVEQLISHGLSTDHVILLAGERYVSANIDATEKELTDIAKGFNLSDWRKLTETHLMKELYNSSFLSKNGIPVSIIDTPRGLLPRPTTQTTIVSLIQWLKDQPHLKNIVFVSNQPNVHYQDAIIKTVFHENGMNINFEVVGPAAEDECEIKSILEGLGSYIWAALPNVLSSLKLKITDNTIKEEFRELYSGNPLIYENLPENLKAMNYDNEHRFHSS